MITGKIFAVCISAESGIPKHPKEEVEIAEFGFLGDYHCRPMRESFSKPGTMKPNNDRHITIVGKEAVDAINLKLGLNLGVGALGENILTQGLGDLSEVAPDTFIFIGNGILLKVVEQNKPCKNLIPYHPHFIKEIGGRRGLLCAVLGGVGCTIHPGDLIHLVPSRMKSYL